MVFCIGAQLHGSRLADGVRITSSGESSILMGAAQLHVDCVVEPGSTSGAPLSQFLLSSGASTSVVLALGPTRVTDAIVVETLQLIAQSWQPQEGRTFVLQLYATDSAAGKLSQTTFAHHEVLAELPSYDNIALATCVAGDAIFHIASSSKLDTSLIALVEAVPRRCVWLCCHEDMTSNEVEATLAEVGAIRDTVKEIEPNVPPFPADVMDAVASAKRISMTLARCDAEREHLFKSFALIESTLATEAEVADEERHLLEERNATLEQLVGQLTTKVESTAVELTAAHRRVEGLEKELGEGEVHRQESMQQSEELLRNLGLTKEELQQQQSSATALGEEKQKLLGTLKRLEEMVDELQTTVTERDAEIRATTAEFASLQSASEATAQEKERLEQRIGSLEGDISEHEETVRAETAKREAEVEQVRAAMAQQRREQLTLLVEFQQKEQQWQHLLRDAEELRTEVLHENGRVKSLAEQQVRTLEFIREASVEADRSRGAQLDGLLQRVRDLSPRRAHPYGTPHHTPVPHNTSAASIMSPPAEYDVSAQRSLHNTSAGHERVLDI